MEFRGAEMARKTQISKEVILQKGLELLIRDGYSSVNIKTLSKEIGCSTQPLVWHFGNMDRLREALVQKALYYANQKLNPQSENFIEAFLQIGCSYVNMALDEPNLFRFIYMGESKQYCRGDFNSILTDNGNATLIEGLSQYLHADKNDVGKFIQRMVVYTHGIASLIAAGVLQGTKKEVYKMISEMGTDLLSKLNADIDLQKILSNITLPKGDA